MKLNALPFLLLPGACMLGALSGGWHGVEWALGVWFAVVAIGTLINVGWQMFERLSRPVLSEPAVPVPAPRAFAR